MHVCKDWKNFCEHFASFLMCIAPWWQLCTTELQIPASALSLHECPMLYLNYILYLYWYLQWSIIYSDIYYFCLGRKWKYYTQYIVFSSQYFLIFFLYFWKYFPIFLSHFWNFYPIFSPLFSNTRSWRTGLSYCKTFPKMKRSELDFIFGPI